MTSEKYNYLKVQVILSVSSIQTTIYKLDRGTEETTGFRNPEGPEL